MINFRFHLVSLVAVFLALGLGILVGSTVIDQGIVNRLDSEIKSVRNEDKERKATGDQLARQNKQLQQYIDETSSFVGDGRLEQQSIAIVADHGVDGDVIKQAEAALRAAGADVPAVLSLDDSWKLESDSQLQELQSALNLSGDAPTTRDAALELLARRLAKAPTSTPTSTSVPATETTSAGKTTSTSTSTSASGATRIDVLTALEQAGFLDVIDGDASAFGAFPSHASSALVITGDNSDFAGTDLTPALVRALTQAKLPTVVGAVYEAGSDPTTAPKRGAAIASVLDDQSLSRGVSTVDDLELVQGRVAAVLALQTIAAGNIGHYGYGSGASAPLPPHPS